MFALFAHSDTPLILASWMKAQTPSAAAPQSPNLLIVAPHTNLPYTAFATTFSFCLTYLLRYFNLFLEVVLARAQIQPEKFPVDFQDTFILIDQD